jgi:GntR family transcriptional repressor for pyruvate dehydrogenase complex
VRRIERLTSVRGPASLFFIMSDIIRTRRSAPPAASVRVVAWLQRTIRSSRLEVGDALPGELEISRCVGVGRSSVREALTALKVLGIIRTRRKGGIRLVRDPVLLELRRYFVEEPFDRKTHAETLVFRAALEWGFGPLMFERTTAGTIRTMRQAVESVEAQGKTWSDINAAEIRYHTALIAGCGNRLASLFAHLYGPIFRIDTGSRPTAGDLRQWRGDHLPMVETLERRDEAAFLAALRAHTHGYMGLHRQGSQGGRRST